MIINPNLEATQEMVDAGQVQLTELEQQIDQADRNIADAQATLATIHEAREQRMRKLQEAREHLQAKEDEHIVAVNYAKLAQGSIREKQTVKDANVIKHDLTTMKKALTEMERTHTGADQAANASEQDLQLTVARIKMEKGMLQEQLHAVQKSHARAHGELGTLLLEEWCERLQLKQSQVETVRSQLHDALSAEQECYEEGCAALASWPALHDEFVGMDEPEDSTLRVMRQALFYIEGLINDIATVPLDQQVRSGKGNSLITLLSVIPDHIVSTVRYHNAANQPLHAQVTLLKAVIEEYRQALLDERGQAN